MLFILPLPQPSPQFPTHLIAKQYPAVPPVDSSDSCPAWSRRSSRCHDWVPGTCVFACFVSFAAQVRPDQEKKSPPPGHKKTPKKKRPAGRFRKTSSPSAVFRLGRLRPRCLFLRRARRLRSLLLPAAILLLLLLLLLLAHFALRRRWPRQRMRPVLLLPALVPAGLRRTGHIVMVVLRPLGRLQLPIPLRRTGHVPRRRWR